MHSNNLTKKQKKINKTATLQERKNKRLVSNQIKKQDRNKTKKRLGRTRVK